MNYGEIEGNCPKGLPKRNKGVVSQSLNTKDIEGCKTGTKGMGAYSKIPHETIRNSINVNDIDGAHFGTVRRGSSD